MNTIGFPNTDIYHEHEQGGEESFWPSFTDIMMVIVMTFLLIAVAVILQNWQLIKNLEASIEAERQAAQTAQSTQRVLATREKENETLEQRMQRLESFIIQLKASLAKSRTAEQQALDTLRDKEQALQARTAELQQAQSQGETLTESLQQTRQQHQQATARISSVEAQLAQQQQAMRELNEQLEARQASLAKTKEQVSQVNTESERLREELELKTQQIEGLTKKQQEGHEQLASLQGEYETLDKKYQKLLRPARSEKDKHVVRVVFGKNRGKSHYSLKDQGDKQFTAYSNKKLHDRLAALKEKYGDQLYIKVIIAEGSNISHDEAWRFTREMLNGYDYYYQGEEQL